MDIWSKALEHWQPITAMASAIATWVHGHRTRWRWVRGTRDWLARRANVEVDNQHLLLEVKRLELELATERRKGATYAAIIEVLETQVSALDSQIGSAEPWDPAQGPYRRANDPPHLRRRPSTPPTR